ncbi:S1/P1 nuclease [Pseudoalteromonas nigrifaciens]|uniref:S1/P1 nuclease n=1 Tax=Pseudoalteromonas nigrifaciens TaxID=28109 RepID=UPI00384E8182
MSRLLTLILAYRFGVKFSGEFNYTLSSCCLFFIPQRSTRPNNQTLISEYLTSTPTSWLVESNNLAESIYNKNETDISYSYIFNHMPIIKIRLQQSGIRLAGLLNSLFDPCLKPHKSKEIKID